MSVCKEFVFEVDEVDFVGGAGDGGVEPLEVVEGDFRLPERIVSSIVSTFPSCWFAGLVLMMPGCADKVNPRHIVPRINRVFFISLRLNSIAV